MVLKRRQTGLWQLCRLRAVQFTMVLKHAMTAHRSQGCLRTVRFAGGSNQELFRRCLRIAWFTRVFNYSKSARCAASCLRAVWFTRGLNQKGVRWSIFWELYGFAMVLKRHTDVKHWRNGLRAVRFTRVLKHVAPQDQYTLCLRAVLFTRGLKPQCPPAASRRPFESCAVYERS